MRKFTIGIVVLLVLLVAVDRLGALVADVALEGVLKDRLHLTHKPSVRVHGIPFLTQVAEGRYGDVEVRGTDLTAGRVSGLDADVHLRGAHVPAKKLFSWNIQALPVDRVTGTVTVPYRQLAALSGIPGLTIRRQGHDLGISAPLPLAGRSVRLSGTAHAVVSGDSITIVPDSARADGAPVPPVLLQHFRYTVPVADLPFRLRVTGVRATAAGLAGSATATDVTIRSNGLR